MHSQFINFLLNIPELIVSHVREENPVVLLLDVEPTAPIQPCPCCHSAGHVIRRGIAYTRKVRHLPAFGRIVFLMLPAIRMTCTNCDLSFVCRYSCVAPENDTPKLLKILWLLTF
ncbi:transposase family protein [Aneurinibacillus sp. Ricciae_BoGa-3]|uniref:transposase family protein n=1 Tax=Aneurinibacillus sp. Ricciae_BoGa-3 TaxID=3022697 RepID=UPI00233F7FB7|nr:transposase family protein [Aneurinibacillus sp. Ricciae_BoGa-3]WCK52993.1 transposase family protein [Aneurinibacillus sp. Ricciae_BoGa-3]